MVDSREEAIKQLLGVAVGSVSGGVDVKVTVLAVVISPIGDMISFAIKFTCNLSLFAASYYAAIWFCRLMIVAEKKKKKSSASNIIKISMSFREN